MIFDINKLLKSSIQNILIFCSENDTADERNQMTAWSSPHIALSDGLIVGDNLLLKTVKCYFDLVHELWYLTGWLLMIICW